MSASDGLSHVSPLDHGAITKKIGGDFWQMEQQGLVVHQRQGCLLCPNMGWKSEPEAEGIDSPALVEVYFLCLPEDEHSSAQLELGIITPPSSQSSYLLMLYI